MARLTQHGLPRVLGTSALFSTAYGNVGSSIYYALGLVASYALGLTPIVWAQMLNHTIGGVVAWRA
jgi:APA family basic amino acid/polyamine antiporter